MRDGERVAGPGVVGELIVRGDHVMQGYWADAEATAERLRQGRWPWERLLATGDLFRTDADGYLYFVSRTDDIIKSRGEKVVPREIEEVLYTASERPRSGGGRGARPPPRRGRRCPCLPHSGGARSIPRR